MIQCSQCQEYKDVSSFYKLNKTKQNVWCKVCTLKFQKDRWKSRKIDAISLFDSKCALCGYNKNLSALDFHHLDPAAKEYNWRQMCKLPWDKIVAELQKCILVCKNCHSEIHNPNYTLDNEQVNNANNSLNYSQYNTIKETGVCPVCNNNVYGTKYCSQKCAKFDKRRVIRPTYEQLILDIDILGYSGTGRKYGVSDNTIRKWRRNMS